jgi:hypothetical protein
MIEFSSLTGELSNTQSLEDIPLEIRQQYTKPEPYIESDDPNIKGNATKLTAGVADIESRVTSLFNFVSNSDIFRYDDSVQNITCNSSNHIRGAVWALQNRRGVCFDFACLLVALLRALGLPSRLSEGIVLDGSSGFIVHDWAEVYLPEVGWTPYDPTWNQAKCNIHMKILNPSYDQYLRWNYTIQRGSLYKFPENSTYAVNDQVCIENTIAPNIIDSIVPVGDSCINLTRELRFDNETIASSLIMSNESQSVENFYGKLGVNLSKNFLDMETIDYHADFRSYPPESLKVEVLAPWNLVFSGSIIPSFNSASQVYTSEMLHFVLVEPLFWIGIIFALFALFAAVALLRKRPHQFRFF